MNEQTIILLFLIILTGSTLFLFIWKAKKEVEYKKDERWQLIQLKANNAVNFLKYLLIVLLAIGETITLFHDVQMTFTFNRILTIGILFIGCQNVIELVALKYYDKQL